MLGMLPWFQYYLYHFTRDITANQLSSQVSNLYQCGMVKWKSIRVEESFLHSMVPFQHAFREKSHFCFQTILCLNCILILSISCFIFYCISCVKQSCKTCINFSFWVAAHLPSPNPMLTLTCYNLTVVGSGKG